MIKTAVTHILAAPPFWPILWRRAVKARPLTVLCYHTLSDDSGGINSWSALRAKDFQAQIANLAKHYDIISLDTALAGEGGDRPRAVITFDDGDLGLYTHLKPILDDTPIPVTLYIATEQFETGRPFWFDRVVNALQAPGEISVEGLGHWTLPGADKGKAHWQTLAPILEALKATDPTSRERFADQIADQGTAFSGQTLGPMSLAQLRELANMPCVTIGAHSHGHELLDQIPLEAARASIAGSKQLLAEWTEQKIRHFAYPNGNHSPALRDILEDLGFESATILEERTAPRGTHPMELPRISIGRYDSAARMRLRLAGW